MSFTEEYLDEVRVVLNGIDVNTIEKAVDVLAKTREVGGRLFIIGVGGSAASASHAVNDFRKITGIEAYTPTDNVSELTARINDDGWASVFKSWLMGSRLNSNDCLLIFSVGGGDLENNVSPNLVMAIQYAKEIGAKIVGVVGRNGGYTAQSSDACVIIPTVNAVHVTPHTESFHSLIGHLFVSHPRLKLFQTKWESMK